jgi:hypothetical protein
MGSCNGWKWCYRLIKRIHGSFQDINELKNLKLDVLYQKNLPIVIYQYTIFQDGDWWNRSCSRCCRWTMGYQQLKREWKYKSLWHQIKLGGDLEKIKSSLLTAIETKSRWSCRYSLCYQMMNLKHIWKWTPMFCWWSYCFKRYCFRYHRTSKKWRVITTS